MHGTTLVALGTSLSRLHVPPSRPDVAMCSDRPWDEELEQRAHLQDLVTAKGKLEELRAITRRPMLRPGEWSAQPSSPPPADEKDSVLWDEDIESLDLLAEMASVDRRLSELRKLARGDSRPGDGELMSGDAEQNPAVDALAGADDPEREMLCCSIRGFYPFPGRNRHGLLAKVFRDTHQAISVRSSRSPDAWLFMDFMTAGGQAHPVWWDDFTKWRVLLGQSIDGEVRVKSRGQRCAKLERLRKAAQRSYDTRMRLYSNNCRVFVARMQREVERLNDEDDTEASAIELRRRALVADARLAANLVAAGALPSLYPLGILALCWQGLAAV